MTSFLKTRASSFYSCWKFPKVKFFQVISKLVVLNSKVLPTPRATPTPIYTMLGDPALPHPISFLREHSILGNWAGRVPAEGREQAEPSVCLYPSELRPLLHQHASRETTDPNPETPGRRAQ